MTLQFGRQLPRVGGICFLNFGGKWKQQISPKCTKLHGIITQKNTILVLSTENLFYPGSFMSLQRLLNLVYIKTFTCFYMYFECNSEIFIGMKNFLSKSCK
jgi:hypothetical protein